jgi:hypothetical protein
MYLLGNTLCLTLFISESIIQIVDIKFSKEMWLETCQGDEQCLYDSAAMGSLEVGERTRQAHAYYTLMQENMKSGKFQQLNDFKKLFKIYCEF